MIVAQIAQTGFPAAHLSDAVHTVLEIMDTYQVSHVPVIDADAHYVGLVSQAALEELQDDQTLADIQLYLSPLQCSDQAFLLDALRILSENALTLLPVVQSDLLLGVVTAKEMIRLLAVFLDVHDRFGVIVIESDPARFSLGEVNRILESNDLSLLHMNTRRESGMLVITLQVSKQEISTAVASLQQNGYVVRYYFGKSEDDAEMQENYQHLLSYLNM
ncbi:MAG: CBS domain-containing protein [Sediminibacterium sp.]|nr:CBS domain-containing protein [Sediminibacterium sp.]